jgi:20S proteasome alpha/beta subunit
MSLIFTHISRHGIVHASDSNLSYSNDQSAGEAKKIFEINYLNAGLTVAGSYEVDNECMDVWMYGCQTLFSNNHK